MSETSDRNSCAHEPCDCRVDAQSGVRDAEGRVYCSEGCRDGRGCGHEGCSCGERA